MEPWFDELAEGRAQAAWDLFIGRYRALILATIRRLVRDHDDVMDVFASTCEALAANDFARLRRFDQGAAPRTAATWVVAVVRNLTVDWLRHRDGRPRPTIPAALGPLQREIYRAVCLDGLGHREAYEAIAAHRSEPLTFPAFLRELRTTARVAPCLGAARRRARETSLTLEVAAAAPDALATRERSEAAERLDAALAGCADDVRIAVMLFVVEGASADDVARVVGWPNAKAVYNRVYRALAALRTVLERQRIGPGDL